MMRSKDPAKALKYWEKISYDFLHKLHQKNLLHGFLTLDSLVVIDDQVKIRNFGYAPLLKVYHQAAIDICSAVLAPAYINKKEFSNLTDIYAFAQIVIFCHPKLKSTQWLTSKFILQYLPISKEFMFGCFLLVCAAAVEKPSCWWYFSTEPIVDQFYYMSMAKTLRNILH